MGSTLRGAILPDTAIRIHLDECDVLHLRNVLIFGPSGGCPTDSVFLIVKYKYKRIPFFTKQT
jgi:hypothetical protein